MGFWGDVVTCLGGWCYHLEVTKGLSMVYSGSECLVVLPVIRMLPGQQFGAYCHVQLQMLGLLQLNE